jgi:hypothetical protein
MNTVVVVAQIAVRFCFIVLLVLGILFWTGHADSLLPLHLVLGFVLVLGLWTLAAVAASRHVPVGLVAIAIAWGLVLPVFGLTQTRIAPGNLHWIVQILHLVIGLVAVGLAENLARRLREGRLRASD